ncbi:MAG: dUTP diphosphatase [archaeon]|jgi:dUTP pyrophosphatase|nr:dUTP diphosphatase [archaeon]MDD2477783.1 dUTP diphosphatase [Candidatus ainarchaeum sp.]MDD3084900.1 dUTP diphosphatase [Candidatus ainarchaeum sp.]MDD4221179.1 dUTP diphosphatase [Candidatus ainarchaeum sp.]MDD4662869.1 dUTP diphosphatase [Candidatus ainarchaeum sp.]
MIKVKRLTDTAILPKKAHEGDAGFDLFSDEEITIAPFERNLVSTGVSFSLPFLNLKNQSLYLRIAPRSGLAVKAGINVFAGVVDFNYRGEIKVCLFNSSKVSFEIKKGDRIAQIIPTLIYVDDILEVEDLDETERGEKGFGSSGL